MFFFFNDTATTEIYTLSLHDALPICGMPAPIFHRQSSVPDLGALAQRAGVKHLMLTHLIPPLAAERQGDRKSTRLNSSHANISYAVFCLKKKKIKLSTYSSLPLHYVF